MRVEDIKPGMRVNLTGKSAGCTLDSFMAYVNKKRGKVSFVTSLYGIPVGSPVMQVEAIRGGEVVASGVFLTCDLEPAVEPNKKNRKEQLEEMRLVAKPLMELIRSFGSEYYGVVVTREDLHLMLGEEERHESKNKTK